MGGRFLNDYRGRYEFVTPHLRTTPLSEINFGGVDAVVHCAALVHQMQGAPEEEYFKINTDLTLKLANLAQQQGVKHFIFLSTAHVFGDSGSIKNHQLRLKPDDKCHPKDPYGLSKLKAEEGLLKISGPNYTVSIIRPPMIYGEGAKGNLLNLANLIQKVPFLPFGYNLNRRSLLYVGNLTHFIDLCLQKKPQGILLPQDERPLSIREIVLLVAKSLNKKSILLPIPHFVVALISRLKPQITARLYGTLALDSSSSNLQLNYSPRFTTEEGFRRMFSYATLR